MRTSWVVAGVIAVVVAGCGGVDVDQLTVTGSQELQGLNGPARLSPDGGRVLVTRGSRACVRGLDGSGERCTDQAGQQAGFDTVNGSWSPDGKRIAFTDDFWRALLEPDIWVFDVESGELRNLTDDGVNRTSLDEPSPDATLDLLPSWSADGRTIRFARQRQTDEQTIELMEISADGGTPRRLRSITGKMFQLFALTWSDIRGPASGSGGRPILPRGGAASAATVAWTVGPVDDTTVRMGSANGTDERVVARADGERKLDQMLLSFSADQRYLLIDSAGPYGQYATDPRLDSGARVLPVAGGDGVPVATSVPVTYPTWAPTGHALAFVTGASSLQVVAEPGGQPREVHRGEGLASGDGRRLSWAGDRILVYSRATPVLLTLSG